MKLRIKSNSVRFRLGEGELEQLSTTGTISCQTVIPSIDGAEAVFRYDIHKAADSEESDLQLTASGFSCRLDAKALATLMDPSEDGVYVKRVYQSAEGKPQGFVFYIEKDKKSKHGKKRDKHHNRKEVQPDTDNSIASETASEQAQNVREP
jgi:hypothetical protein